MFYYIEYGTYIYIYIYDYFLHRKYRESIKIIKKATEQDLSALLKPPHILRH